MLERIAMLLAVALACSCDAHEGAPNPAPVGSGQFRHRAFYERLAADADSFTQKGGDWLEDQGDAPFYGLGFYARTAGLGAGTARSERARFARTRALGLVKDADLVNGDVNELIMSAFGLIESIDASGDGTDLAVLEQFVDRLRKLVSLVGWYLDSMGDKSWAFSTYGPTSISALVGLLVAQHAYVIGGERAAERVEWAQAMEQRIAERAWNGASFEFGAGRQGLFLYPNVAMMILEGRLFQLTREERYRERALALYRAIQPLKLSGDPTRYRSPYSADYAGARTPDYSTLSSQNYLMFALMVLAEITGERAYVREVDSVLDSISTELRGTWCLSHAHPEPCEPVCAAGAVCVGAQCAEEACQGGVLHHWIDGRIATPSDKEYFCSGCNLQLLYVMWYRQNRLGP
jgi:hypothetical protein